MNRPVRTRMPGGVGGGAGNGSAYPIVYHAHPECKGRIRP